MVPITPQLSQFKSEFESARRWRRAHREPLQFSDVRWDALDRFLSLGFPAVNDADWQFTDISSIAEKFFSLPPEAACDANAFHTAPFRLPENSGTELLFINGYYVPSASSFRGLPKGARVCPLSEMLDLYPSEIENYLARIGPHAHQAFMALNTALFTDGACVLIPAHTASDAPIHLCFVSTGKTDREPAMSHPRVLVVLNEGSQATIVESYVGPDGIPYLTNTVTEIVLGENSTLHHYKLQHESMKAYHVSSTHLAAASGANCSTHSIILGGAITRNDIVATLGGQRIRYSLTGLHLTDRERLIDNHTTIHHDASDCVSRYTYRGIVADHARSVADSKIIIAPDACKAEVCRTTRNFLFSKDARIYSSSHVENLADEVNFTQSEISQHIDEDIQLRKTELKPREARRRAIEAAIPNMLSELILPPLHHTVDRLLRQQLEKVLDHAD